MRNTRFAILGLLLTCPAWNTGQFDYKKNADGVSITIIGYTGSNPNVIIPGSINGLPVTGVGQWAFMNNSLTSVTIPSGVTSIGLQTFFGCTSLTNVTMPNSITNIGELAFSDCRSLTSVTIPSGVASIGLEAFEECTSLTNVTMPTSLAEIGEAAFSSCASLTSVTIPSGVTSIAPSIFENCTSLTNVTIPNSVTNIGDQAFAGNSLIRLTIPSSVRSISNGAFGGCLGMTNLIIGRSVANIGDDAFSECIKLKSVFFMGNAPATSPSAFAGNGDLVFYYLPGATGWYLPGATNWYSTFLGRLALLWNPLIQPSGISFGVKDNQFGFNITGTRNIPIVVEVCTNLANPVWAPLQSLSLTHGLVYFSEPFQADSPGCFYRIRSP